MQYELRQGPTLRNTYFNTAKTRTEGFFNTGDPNYKITIGDPPHTMFTDDSPRTRYAARYLSNINPKDTFEVNGIRVHILPISPNDKDVFFVLGQSSLIKPIDNVAVVVSIPKWIVEKAMQDYGSMDMLKFLTAKIKEDKGLGKLLTKEVSDYMKLKGEEIGGVIFWNAGVPASSSFSAVGYTPGSMDPTETDERIIEKLFSLGAKLPHPK